MIGISELFKRIQGIHAREIQTRTAVQNAIKKAVGVDIPLEAVSFSGETVIVKNQSSSLRSAIYIKKAAIIDEINKNQAVKKVADIR